MEIEFKQVVHLEKFSACALIERREGGKKEEVSFDSAASQIHFHHFSLARAVSRVFFVRGRERAAKSLDLPLFGWNGAFSKSASIHSGKLLIPLKPGLGKK